MRLMEIKMAFAKVAALLFICAAPVGVGCIAMENAETNAETKTADPPTILPLGFGCPFNRDTCDRHCRNDLGHGRIGGYCGGFFRTTCICIFK